ncbi:hypothetical protein PSD17_11710 [Pseudonocardia sp. D17]|nr:hypothetical protein PSD17_11710 [Pseudonocardia sp. D17]
MGSSAGGSSSTRATCSTRTWCAARVSPGSAWVGAEPHTPGQGAGQGAEAAPLPALYPAEEYQQRYLAEVPNGDCGTVGTGVPCRPGAGVAASGRGVTGPDCRSPRVAS